MGTRILEIVVFLMDRMRENRGQLDNIDQMASDLRTLGYSENEITSAYSWLIDRYDASGESFYSEFPANHSSQRILTEYERFLFTTEAHGLLLKLLHHELIDDEQLEAILERASMFGPAPISLEQAKLITSAVVFRDVAELDQFLDDDMEFDPSHSVN